MLNLQNLKHYPLLHYQLSIKSLSIKMFTINLNNLIFHAYHGVHEEECILGNDFEVNVSVSFETDEPITSLKHTINYATVFEIVKQRMALPTPLLETLAQELAQEIYNFNERIKSIEISVEKKNPPIKSMQGSVSVHYKISF